jgi:hypothetical protein
VSISLDGPLASRNAFPGGCGAKRGEMKNAK